MKKQERTDYSLTARERKQKRRDEQKKNQSKAPAPSASIESEEQNMVAAQAKNKRTAVITYTIVGVAILLIIVAVLLPVILFAVNPYRGNGKVVARFNLSNGMILEYEILEKEYDTAATNFIFLAENKFFDNTVFYDAQNGWLRFGGYESQPVSNTSGDYSRTHHRKDSEEYCKNFGALPNKRFPDSITRKFGYRLNADNNGTDSKLLEQSGVLTFRYSDTSTEFQTTYKEQATDQITSISGTGQSTYDIRSTMVGKALNDKTIRNLAAIAETAQVNSNISSGYLWYPPTPDIKINSVRIYNLSGSKWNKFDFIEYLSGNDSAGRPRLSSWNGMV